ncbi:hypothetical protein [Actinopolymorpha alba]|uniref:hypothetical protein n=1 Tax=Actinopolymorpha alba TaxID=533267 RepID=UPI0012F6936D|nr:hypothetical protein [Actinopolymorpha alba]
MRQLRSVDAAVRDHELATSEGHHKIAEEVEVVVDRRRGEVRLALRRRTRHHVRREQFAGGVVQQAEATHLSRVEL